MIRNRKLLFTLIPFLLVFVLAASAVYPQRAGKQGKVWGNDRRLICPMGKPYHLTLPKNYSDKNRYWIVVGIHGAGGRAQSMSIVTRWVEKGNVIVIRPEFGGQYQNATGESAQQLIGLFKDLQSKYTLHDKMFLFGFSGGAQFAHRFAMNHPGLVCGVSAHSAGSWATRNFGRINSEAKHIPFSISCGEKDAGKAWPTAPLSRVEWFREFEEEMKKRGFCIRAKLWPRLAHRPAPGIEEMSEECFRIATCGVSEKKFKAFQKKKRSFKRLSKKAKAEKAEKVVSAMKDKDFALGKEWTDNEEALVARRKAARIFLEN